MRRCVRAWTAAALLLAIASDAHAAVGTLADSSGEVVAWGNNLDGQTNVPTGWVSAVAAGGSHSLALRSDGTLAGWGLDLYGQVSDTPSGTFLAVAGGGYHSLALRSDGTLASWGFDIAGQVSNTPSGRFVGIAAGGWHSLSIRSDGTLASWGYPVGNTPPGTFSAVAAGSFHSLALRSDGTLASWGDNGVGQVSNTPSDTFSAVAAGGNHSLALRSNGTLASWGDDEFGQVSNSPSGSFSAVATGGEHSLALRSDGTLAGWGSNAFGRVSNAPSGTFVAVSAGGAHSLALRARTDYDGDLLVSYTGVPYGPNGLKANLNRSINVAGNMIVHSPVYLYNSPTAHITGKLVIGPQVSQTIADGSIIAHGLDIQGNLGIAPTMALVSTAGLSGPGWLMMWDNAQATIVMAPASQSTGVLQLRDSSTLTFTGSGFQTAGGLLSGYTFESPFPEPHQVYEPGGTLRLGGGQRLRFTSDVPPTGIGNYNGGRIELLGGAGAGASTIEFAGALFNAANTGWITGHDAVMRFEGGLNNLGTVTLTSGNNDVFGDVTNAAGGLVLVTGGAGATFYGDVVQNGTLRVRRVGNTTSTAVFLGSFTGSGGTTGGGDIFFEGDLMPGNSPGIVTFANNVSLGAGTTTHIELGGTAAGTQYDRIAVTGELALDGVLLVSLINGFVPSAGQVFDILDFNPTGSSGSFSTIALPTLGGALSWDTSQLYTSGVLSVAAAGLPGDFNGDGRVDAADYVLWRKSPSSYGGDPNGYDTWRANFGSASASAVASSSTVPEPSTMLLSALALFGLLTKRRA